MSEDRWYLLAIFLVWAALAALYGLVPAFRMPGSALIWGAGAGLFLLLAALVVWAERRRRAKP